MKAHELKLQKVERMSLHLQGIDPETGEEYPQEECVLIQPSVSIRQIKELIENGQPINTLVHEMSHTPEDEEGVSQDDDVEEQRAEAAFKKAEDIQRFDDPLMAMAYMRGKISDREWRESHEDKQPTPQPAPGPTPEPAPGPTPEPAPGPTPEPAPTD